MVDRRGVTVACIGAVIAVMLVVAGCGGSGGGDKQTYERGMRKVGAQISTASSAVADVPADATNAQRTAAIQAQAAAITHAADIADQLDPPTSAKADHDKLVSSLRAYGKLLDQLADASNDSAKQAALLGKAGAIVARLTTASTNLCKQGYTFGASSKCADSGDSK